MLFELEDRVDCTILLGWSFRNLGEHYPPLVSSRLPVNLRVTGSHLKKRKAAAIVSPPTFRKKL